VGLTTYDDKDPDTAYPPIVPLRPPAGAPNVLIVLIDDVGFGASSAFGGPAGRRTSSGWRREGSSTGGSTRPPCARRPARPS
jgi:arylsulfatase